MTVRTAKGGVAVLRPEPSGVRSYEPQRRDTDGRSGEACPASSGEAGRSGRPPRPTVSNQPTVRQTRHPDRLGAYTMKEVHMQQTTQAVREALRTNGIITSLATLTRVAIEDGRRLDPALYVPDYGVYHDPSESREKCQVCLAGAAIVGTLAADPRECIGPSDYNEEEETGTSLALRALDYVRCGSYSSAYALIGVDYPFRLRSILDEVPVPARTTFEGFGDFGEHLDDLELRVLPALRDFEDALVRANAEAAERAAQQEREAKIEALTAERDRLNEEIVILEDEGVTP